MTNCKTLQRRVNTSSKLGIRELAGVLPECWNSPYATAAFPDYAEKLPDVGDSDAVFASSDNGKYGPSSRMLVNEFELWMASASCLLPVQRVQLLQRKNKNTHITLPGGIPLPSLRGGRSWRLAMKIQILLW
eukprot:CCRYP_014968-RA/>CCRYP_014968-RA protein AED:0.15 eAED:0.15 QI:0/-1/0/1/-1/1/1/0/131